MNDTFLLVFDQARSICFALLAYFLFCHRAVPKRSHFKLRVGISFAVCLVTVLSWVPLYQMLNINYEQYVIYGYLHLIILGLLQVASVRFCFDIGLGQTLFRCIIGKCTEVINTVLLRYLLVMMFFPTMPEEHFLLYVICMLMIGGAVYSIAYFYIARRLQNGENGESIYDRTSAVVVFLLIYVGYWVIVGMMQALCERQIEQIAAYEELEGALLSVQYFCIVALIVLSAMIQLIMTYLYEASTLQGERDILDQLLREKEQQYAFVKENTDLINRKCHEIKHQLAALETAGDESRSQMIREVSNAVNLYDSVVKTGNEVLDTILTEKSVLCASRGIKLSCMANIDGIAHIKVMDLYFMLDTAMENAMESVVRLADPQKKLISFMLTTVGDMVYISVENYYEGEIRLRGGYPVAAKRAAYGRPAGIRNIRRIAKRYGGDIQIHAENQIFQLQIILPRKIEKRG